MHKQLDSNVLKFIWDITAMHMTKEISSGEIGFNHANIRNSLHIVACFACCHIFSLFLPWFIVLAQPLFLRGKSYAMRQLVVGFHYDRMFTWFVGTYG